LWFEPKWKSLEQGSTFTSVNSNDIKSIKLNNPTQLEQEKISKFLSSIDDQIELLTSQIDKSKTWKKGLLQKMFV
jgi:type I restriction enzyme S subunit